MNDNTDIESQIQQLLQLIQKGMTQKNMNTAALANTIGMDRKNLKRMLTGSHDISIRDFMRISLALQIDAEFLAEHEQSPLERSDAAEKPHFAVHTSDSEDTNNWDPQPLENHTKQLVAYGFALGCNMLLLCNTEKLKKSGVPEQVRNQFKPRLPIQLDAEYHPYNKPQYFDDGLELRLSFDALYTCFFPWNSIEQVIFRPSIDDDSNAEDSKPNPPTLRLV